MVDFRESIEDGYRDLLRVWGLGYKPKKEYKRKASRK